MALMVLLRQICALPPAAVDRRRSAMTRAPHVATLTITVNPGL
jgi:hypothetical protein